MIPAVPGGMRVTEEEGRATVCGVGRHVPQGATTRCLPAHPHPKNSDASACPTSPESSSTTMTRSMPRWTVPRSPGNTMRTSNGRARYRVSMAILADRSMNGRAIGHDGRWTTRWRTSTRRDARPVSMMSKTISLSPDASSDDRCATRDSANPMCDAGPDEVLETTSTWPVLDRRVCYTSGETTGNRRSGDRAGTIQLSRACARRRGKIT